MIVKMERISVFGMINDKDSMLDRLIRKQCIQFIDPEEALDELALKATIGRREVTDYQEKLNRYETTLKEMESYVGKMSLFSNRPRLRYDQLKSPEIAEAAEAQCCKIEALIGELNALKQAKETAIIFKKSLTPWVSSALPLEIRSTENIHIGYYVLPPNIDKTNFSQALEANAPASHIEYIREDKEHKYAIVINHKEHSEITWDVLEQFGAIAAYFNDVAEGAPKKIIADLNAKLQVYDNDTDEKIGELKIIGGDLSALRYGCDALTLQIRLNEANERLVMTKTSFGFSGWVPEDKKPEIQEIFDEFNCEYKFEPVSPKNEDNPPILFKNNIIAQASEAVVQIYALPNYYSVDPNYLVAPFFCLFFGMMLSDAAYGLILFLGGLFIIKKMDISHSVKSFVMSLMFGGASAIFWGIVFGSWFGDITTVVAKTFFNVDFAMPALINPLDDPVTVLVLSLSLGLVHIVAGMGVKAYLLIIRGRIWSAVFDVGLWYLIMLGVGFIVLGGVFSSVGEYIVIFGAIGLILTQGREKKSLIGKLINGLASLYNVIGYLSDILSYSRILALGLSTAVIASVFNTMGCMLGGNILGFLLLAVVFLIGNVFNLLISTFSSFVHTARLQYVEFFKRFFEGGGKPFQPFQLVTKYCLIYDKK